MSDHLPTDIIVRILLNLPVEFLLRCTAVCRSWHSLITGPSFIATQVLHRASNCQMALLHGYTRLVGSVHGLVCMSVDIYGRYTNGIVLWNPSIRRHVELPKPSVTYNEVGPHFFALGFGYDTSTNDYKVVRVVYARGSDSYLLPPLVEVYAIKEKVWKRVNAVGVDSYILEHFRTQCFLQGRVHWFAYGNRNQGVENSVLMFEIGNEKFRKMKLPNRLINADPKNLLVLEIGGFLSILHYYYVRAEFKRQCDIWVMKVYDEVESWSKMYTIDVPGASGIVLGLRGKDEILMVKNSVEFSNTDDFSSYAMSSGELISYNPKTHETHNFILKGIIDARCSVWYFESLVLLDKDSAASSDGKNMKRHEKRSVTRLQAESNADKVSEEESTSSSDVMIDEESKAPSDFDLMFSYHFGQLMKLGMIEFN